MPPRACAEGTRRVRRGDRDLEPSPSKGGPTVIGPSSYERWSSRSCRASTTARSPPTKRTLCSTRRWAPRRRRGRLCGRASGADPGVCRGSLSQSVDVASALERASSAFRRIGVSDQVESGARCPSRCGDRPLSQTLLPCAKRRSAARWIVRRGASRTFVRISRISARCTATSRVQETSRFGSLGARSGRRTCRLLTSAAAFSVRLRS